MSYKSTWTPWHCYSVMGCESRAGSQEAAGWFNHTPTLIAYSSFAGCWSQCVCVCVHTLLLLNDSHPAGVKGSLTLPKQSQHGGEPHTNPPQALLMPLTPKRYYLVLTLVGWCCSVVDVIIDSEWVYIPWAGTWAILSISFIGVRCVHLVISASFFL